MRHTTRTDRDGARIIVCPYCVRRYRLPESLIGPGGAEIRCPGCSERFALRIVPARPAEKTVAIPAAREPSAAPPPTEGRADDLPEDVLAGEPSPWTMADEIVARLEHETGGKLADAQARGALFTELGPRLMDAFDAFRRAAGPAADAAEFRAALERHCGVTVGGLNREATPRF
jgi:predicted Zn finger-like uncharacterized protein